MSKHYCYLIEGGPFVKVGYTSNLDRRMEQLQTGNPYKLGVLQAYVFDTELAARQLEAQLHRDLKPYRAQGEWFSRKPSLKEIRRMFLNNGTKAPRPPRKTFVLTDKNIEELEIVAAANQII